MAKKVVMWCSVLQVSNLALLNRDRMGFEMLRRLKFYLSLDDQSWHVK